jgi:hypothetical protein
MPGLRLTLQQAWRLWRENARRRVRPAGPQLAALNDD